MSKINDLIKELCPNGVEYKTILECLSQPITDGPHETPKLVNDGIPFISVEAIHDGIIDLNKCRGYITKEYDEVCSKKYKPQKGDVYFVKSASLGKVAMVTDDSDFNIWSPLAAMRCNTKIMLPRFLFHILQTSRIQEEAKIQASTGSQPNLSMRKLEKFVIAVPPLEIQEEIVRILDKFGELEAELESELEARKSQYEFWREKLLNTGNSNQEYITLGDIGKVCMCKRIMKNETSESGDVPFYKIGTFGKQADAYISYDIFNDYKKRFSYPKKGEILVSCSGTIGRSVVFDGEDAYFQDSNIVWLSNDESKVLNKFLYYFYQTSPWNISDGGTIKRLYNNQFISAKVPLYSLEEQKKIVNILERFDKLINDITVGLPAEIELRRKQYEYYRNKLLSFEELSVSE